MSYKIFIVIALLSAAVYANSLDNDFVYDDGIYVVENPYIRDVKNIPASFSHPEYIMSLGYKSHYRPLVMISYTINYWISGLNPTGFRLTNLLFHIGTSFMLFLTVGAMLGNGGGGRSKKLEDRSKKLEVRSKTLGYGFSNFLPLTSNFFIAVTSALIFAVHPFNSEAVNYITARSSLMGGLFYLLAFYFWVRYRGGDADVRSEKSEVRSKRDGGWLGFSNFLPLTSNIFSLQYTFYFASLLAFLLGMLSKEMVITLPIVLWLYDRYFTPGGEVRSKKLEVRSQKLDIRSETYGDKNLTSYLLLLTSYFRLSFVYLPFLVFPAAALIARAIYTGDGIIPSFKRDMASQLFTMIPVLPGYLKLMLLPTGLTIAHDVEIYSTPFAFPVILSALILILYVINAIYLYKRKEREWRVLSFFMIWYFVTLFVIVIVPLNSIMQENRCYISGAVFAVFLAVLIGVIGYSRQRCKIAYGILFVLIVSYGIGTVYRNTVWKNGVTLWTDAMAKSPYEPFVYTNLGGAYKDAGDYEKAKDALYRGLRLSPGDALLHYNLGALYAMTGEFDNSLDAFDRALSSSPEAAPIYAEKGNVYLSKGETEKGMSLIHVAIQKKPGYAPAHYYMAKGLQKMGRKEEAGRELDIAIRYANASNDRRLVERITRYRDRGYKE